MRVAALLRGINIGNRRVKMAALRDGLAAAGAADVSTYVQSGNVLLTLPEVAEPQTWLEAQLAEICGFAVPAVLRTKAELAGVIAGNPYPEAGGTTLHVVFFAAEAPLDALVGVDLASHAPEHCTVTGREVYLHLPNGMGRSTLPMALEKAGRRAAVGTTRNWNTVVKLHDLL